jgi:hypothetical protein
MSKTSDNDTSYDAVVIHCVVCVDVSCDDLNQKLACLSLQPKAVMCAQANQRVLRAQNTLIIAPCCLIVVLCLIADQYILQNDLEPNLPCSASKVDHIIIIGRQN